jgi:acyl-lipid omega-6 desaturase (Delta-12 desaturase)
MSEVSPSQAVPGKTSPSHHTEVPIAPNLPMPHRKVIRTWLIPLSQRVVLFPILLLIVDYAILLGLLSATVAFDHWALKLLSGMAAGFMIGRIFIIGHDGCHQSLTPNRTLNKWLGRAAFMSSLTPFSLWDIGHNVVHHGYTNLKGVDFVWAPLTAEEFAALPPMRRFMERLYRSGWAPGLYYMIEIWWRRMFYPNSENMPTRRSVFLWDNILVTAYAVVWIVALWAAATLTSQSVLLTLLMGFVVPFMFWCAMIGFVVYVHHTHTSVSWHDERTAWAKAQPFVSTTVHLTFPMRIGALMHHIMEHTAHHVDMSIPLYRLRQAQSKLENMLPERIVIQRFSWRWYFETAGKCKLYNFTERCWTDFKGRPTSRLVVKAA